jgi:carbamoyl-phosphate synthase large subunit
LNILITAASRRVSLIRFFKVALNKLCPTGKIITTDLNPLSPGLYFCDKFYCAPLCTSPDYIETIKSICIKEKISLLIPTIDEELPIYAKLSKDFEDIGVRVIVSNYNAVIICNDKMLTYKIFLEKSIPTPKTYLPEELDVPSMKYPLFIKPRFGRGSVNSFMIRSEKELVFFLDYIDKPVVQEYLVGKEFTIDVLADLNGKVISSVPRERLLIRAGVSDRGVTIDNDALMEWGKRIVEMLGLIGPVNIQGKLFQDKIKFIEINPRFSGGIQLTVKSGPNFPELLIRMHLGDDIKPIIGEYKKRLVMVSFEESIFLKSDSLGKINKGESKTPKDYDILSS